MSAASDDMRHKPVMLDEVLDALRPRDGGIYIDGTFGAGGYTCSILDAADCIVMAIDRDPSAIDAGRAIEARYDGRLVLLEGPFADMVDLLAERGIEQVDGVTLDLGVSSMQLDEADRGFSFRFDGPLDMRMEGPGSRNTPSAADVLNGHSETEIARIIAILGEERHARSIARMIVKTRLETPFSRTIELADLIEKLAGGAARRDRIHPATRTFQALRIYVNNELEQLCSGLHAAEVLLKPGGRIAVVSFHSLEDRIVKRFLADRTGKAASRSRHMPDLPDAGTPSFNAVSRGADKPSKAEIDHNPRARSARLRVAERSEAPAFAYSRKGLGLPTVEVAR